MNDADTLETNQTQRVYERWPGGSKKVMAFKCVSLSEIQEDFVRKR